VRFQPAEEGESFTGADNRDDDGWMGSAEPARRSALISTAVQGQIRDEEVQHRLIGLRDQLLALAEGLDASSDLAVRQPAGMALFPDLRGADAILARWLTPWAMHYLTALQDAAEPNASLASRLAQELVTFASADLAKRTAEIWLAGVRTDSAISYRDVLLRPLTDVERGAWLAKEWRGGDIEAGAEIEATLPSARHDSFMPMTLLSVTYEHDSLEWSRYTDIPVRVILALMLLGFEVSSSGAMTVRQEPHWVGGGVHTSWIPVEPRIVAPERRITSGEFACGRPRLGDARVQRLGGEPRIDCSLAMFARMRR
jgi:hypothetical protein